jgi:hypothetical protein
MTALTAILAASRRRGLRRGTRFEPVKRPGPGSAGTRGGRLGVNLGFCHYPARARPAGTSAGLGSFMFKPQAGQAAARLKLPNSARVACRLPPASCQWWGHPSYASDRGRRQPARARPGQDGTAMLSGVADSESIAKVGFCMKPGSRKRAWLPALGFLRSGTWVTDPSCNIPGCGRWGQEAGSRMHLKF